MEQIQENRERLKEQREEFDEIRRNDMLELQEECKQLRDRVQELKAKADPGTLVEPALSEDLPSGEINDMMTPNKEFVEFLESRYLALLI